MKGLLARIFRGEASPEVAKFESPSAALHPECPFVAIGDVHGCADLLLELGRLIEAHCPGWPVVLLGDYVDRGEQSRDVLEILMSMTSESASPVTCLMGNHERMVLDFLDDPVRNGPRWLSNGGLQALTSFGVAPARGVSGDARAFDDLRDRLITAMGEATIDWLRSRPLSWHSGNVWAVHAAADPDLPMTAQPDDVLLWGHPEFRRRPRSDGKWVVHGHTVVESPHMRDGRIALDTGAYATGCLSAAAISADGVIFIQAGSS